KMREPRAPFLELSCYSRYRKNSEMLELLIDALLAHGAQFVGTGLAHVGFGDIDSPFESITDEIAHEISVRTKQELLDTLRRPSTRIVQVLMSGASGTTSDVMEIITFDRISARAGGSDHHPVSILTDGNAFSTPRGKGNTPGSRRIGASAASRLCALAE